MKPRARYAGTRLGRYDVGVRLAAGGTASVYLARLSGPHSFERLVALKIIHDHLLDEPEFIDMFLDEANLASRLSHPNIVHVYELAREDDVLFLAMEYLHGQPLSRLYKRANERGVRLPYDVVAWVGAESAEGLHHAHELADDDGTRLGLVHRDVSPQNIFITYDGQVKVVDFGIARAEGRIAKTALGKIKGKFSYMSPEQAQGQDIDHRADLFALGATVYEVATGERLFKGEDELDTLRKVVSCEVPDPREKRDDFPAELHDIMAKALAPALDARYADGQQFASDLRSFIASRGQPQLRDRLSQLMNELFADERALKERAIVELRQRGLEPAESTAAVTQSEPPDETRLASEVDSAARAPARRSPVLAVLGGMAVVGLIAVGLAAVVLRGPDAASAEGPSPAAQPAPPEAVSIEVTVEPELDDAVVTIGGVVVSERPARLQVKRGGTAVAVAVSAPGYQPAKMDVVPDRDRAVLVPLRQAEPEPAASAPTSEPARDDAREARRTEPARTGDDAEKKDREPASTGAKSRRKKGGSLITDNPF